MQTVAMSKSQLKSVSTADEEEGYIQSLNLVESDRKQNQFQEEDNDQDLELITELTEMVDDLYMDTEELKELQLNSLRIEEAEVKNSEVEEQNLPGTAK